MPSILTWRHMLHSAARLVIAMNEHSLVPLSLMVVRCEEVMCMTSEKMCKDVSCFSCRYVYLLLMLSEG